MKPVFLIQLGVVLLVLPVVLGAVAFLLTNLIAAGASGPQAAGGLATAAAILLGILFVGGFAGGLLVGGIGLVWGLLSGKLFSMGAWPLVFVGILVLYVGGLGVLTLGPGLSNWRNTTP